ncbi:MAG: type II toxin-antitoxin system HicB family antitoxin [Synergistaceae bacterium]|jgi:predicted RNase H-like HicB family nuclease|nr:type II toxin-antitoxin system HicB family antitoxin [Synergistaceae bacterium]
MGQYPDFYSYPAIFSTDGDGWEVSFPDLDNCYTAADTLEEAIVEARYVLEDIMYLREKEKDEIPASAKLEDVRSKPGGNCPACRRRYAGSPAGTQSESGEENADSPGMDGGRT